MRKRSSYKPKPVLQNPLGYVLDGITPVGKHDNFLIDLKIKNHGALTSLTQGKATRQDVDVLIQAVNIVEALYRLGFGRDYFEVVRSGMDALFEVGVRGAESGRFVLKAAEMGALNTVMELHDAQFDVITVRDVDRAINIVIAEHLQKKMRRIVKKETPLESTV